MKIVYLDNFMIVKARRGHLYRKIESIEFYPPKQIEDLVEPGIIESFARLCISYIEKKIVDKPFFVAKLQSIEPYMRNYFELFGYSFKRQLVLFVLLKRYEEKSKKILVSHAKWPDPQNLEKCKEPIYVSVKDADLRRRIVERIKKLLHSSEKK